MPNNSQTKILIVDDEIGIRELLSDILGDEGYFVISAPDAETAWTLRMEEKPDLILLDIWMPNMDGVSLLKQWFASGLAKVPVIMMSGHATIESAVEATKLGAFEVMEKPITTKQLLAVVNKALSYDRDTDVNPYLQQANFGETVVMRQFKKMLLDIAAESFPALFVGPTDCGAEFFAQFLIHPKMPTLFIEKGKQLEGDIDPLLRQVEHGLLIVRPIDLSNNAWQNGLLGVIREASKRNIRVVVCGAESPSFMAKRFRFNEMLLSALSRRVVHIPLLKDYQSDLPAVAELIIDRIVADTDKAGVVLSAAARETLVELHYDNHFTELLSVIRSALLYVRGDTIDAATIKMMATKWSHASIQIDNSDDMYALPFRQARELFERGYFIRLVDSTNGNIPEAAKKAELERTYFYRKLKQYKGGDYN